MFTLYAIAKFIHIAGALGLFITLGIEWIIIVSLRQTDNINSIELLLGILSGQRKIQGISWAAILIPGIYMMATVWRQQDWISIAFLLIIFMIVLGAVLSGRVIKNLKRQIENQDLTNLRLQNELRSNSLIYSISLRTAIALEIILLMTIKPDLTGAILSLIAALIIGFISVYFFRRKQVVYKIEKT